MAGIYSSALTPAGQEPSTAHAQNDSGCLPSSEHSSWEGASPSVRAEGA